MANPALSYDILADFKLAMRVKDASYDDIIQGELNSAARLIDRCCGRSFFTSEEQPRLFNAPRNSIIVAIDHRTIQEIKVYGVTLPAEQYRSLKMNSAQPGFQMIERIDTLGQPVDWHQNTLISPYGAISVTADWGPEDPISSDVVLANRMVCSRMLADRKLLYLMTGGADEDSNSDGSGPYIDNKVLALIGYLILPPIPNIMGD